jgi:hypothetical protein
MREAACQFDLNEHAPAAGPGLTYETAHQGEGHKSPTSVERTFRIVHCFTSGNGRASGKNRFRPFRAFE